MKVARRVLLLFFVACWVSTTAVYICPYDVFGARVLPDGDVVTQGCSCDNQELDCFNLVEIPPLKNESFIKIVTTATFQKGLITQIPSRSLPANLTGVSFIDNPIAYIADDAFENSATTLLTLMITGASFRRLPSALNNLPNLVLLAVMNTSIVDINNRPGVELVHTFPFANKLFYLDFTLDGLTVVPNFRNLTNLEEIHLGHNKVTNIPHDVFPVNVTTIDLKSNKLTKLTDTSFRGYSVLESLNLGDNPITTISDSAFISLASLKTLELQNTLLKTIPSNMQALTSLQLLNMSGTPLDCDCPRNPELVSWYASYNYQLVGKCADLKDVNTYLTSPCQLPTTTTTISTTTTITTTTTSSTTTTTTTTEKNDAATFTSGTFLKFTFFFLFCFVCLLNM